MDLIDKIAIIVLKIIIILFIIMAVICACSAHDKTWTIDDGKFKMIYDDKEECIKSNLGVGKAEICDDSNQVIYRNK